MSPRIVSTSASEIDGAGVRNPNACEAQVMPAIFNSKPISRSFAPWNTGVLA